MSKTLCFLMSAFVAALVHVPAWAQQMPPPPTPITITGVPLAPVEPPPVAPPMPQADFPPLVEPPMPQAYTPPPVKPPMPPAYAPPPSVAQPVPQYYAPPPILSPYAGNAASTPPMPFQSPASAGEAYFSAGLGLYFLQPVFQSNPAFINGHTSNSGAAVYYQREISQHMSVAPQGWLSYTFDGGLGIRGRWFEFSGDGQADATIGDRGLYLPGGTSLPATNPGDHAAASTLLYCYVADLEATYSVLAGNWSFIGSAGVRYVHLDQTYQLSAFDPTNGFTNVNASNTFDGVGPTAAIEAHRRIAGSHFALYGSARGSLVYGSTHQHAGIFDPVNGVSHFGDNQTSLLSIGELEMGGEWDCRLGRFRLFAQLGFVGQFWAGAGNSSQVLGVNTVGNPTATNFGFIGGVFRSGVDF